MESTAIQDFKKRHDSFLEGIIEDKETRDSLIHSSRLSIPKIDKPLVFLIKVPYDMIIPAVALTKKDQVCVCAVEDKTDRKNGYDGSLRGLANISTGKVYEFKGEDPKNYLRARIPSSEVR